MASAPAPAAPARAKDPGLQRLIEGLGAPLSLDTPLGETTAGDLGSRAGHLAPEAICPGQAQMREVVNFTRYPWSSLVYVRCTYRRFGAPPMTISGTGWLAAPGLVVTAAHNVYKHDLAEGLRRAVAVELIAGHAGPGSPVAATARVAPGDILYSPRFADGPALNRRQDFCFLRVRDPAFTEVVGRPLPLAVVEEGCRDSVLVSGYPVPVGAPIRVRTGRLHTGEGRMAPGGGTLTHRYAIQTLGGQSGGPVIWVNPDDHDEIAAIGIHVHGECPFNMARRIDAELLGLAERLVRDAGAAA